MKPIKNVNKNIKNKNNFFAKPIKNKKKKGPNKSSWTNIYKEMNKELLPLPLEPRKLFYKRVHYQDILTVNSSGNAFIGGCPRLLGMFSAGSTASPILYSNDTNYDPNSNTNATTGGWNTNIIANGVNIDPNIFTQSKVMKVLLSVSITAVSNLNKQGQIHIFEDIDKNSYYGTSTDTTRNDLLLNQYSIPELPRCTHYKCAEVMNMDSNTKLEYTYIPLSLYNQEFTIPTSYTSAGTLISVDNKNFGIIASGCYPGTTLKLEYEIDLALEVVNSNINNYPPKWSNSVSNPDPILAIMQRNVDNVIRTHKHENQFLTTKLYDNIINRVTVKPLNFYKQVTK